MAITEAQQHEDDIMTNNNFGTFETLVEALESEGVAHLWPEGLSIAPGESQKALTGNTWVALARRSDGRYIRPVTWTA